MSTYKVLKTRLSTLFAFPQMSWHVITHRRTRLLYINIFIAEHMFSASHLHIYGMFIEMYGYVPLLDIVTFKGAWVNCSGHMIYNSYLRGVF